MNSEKAKQAAEIEHELQLNRELRNIFKSIRITLTVKTKAGMIAESILNKTIEDQAEISRKEVNRLKVKLCRL